MSRSQTEGRYTDARKLAETRSTGMGGTYIKKPDKIGFYKIKTGQALLDILPYEVSGHNFHAKKGALHWEKTFHVHKQVGAAGDSYLCARMMHKERCPVCDYRNMLVQRGKATDEQLIKDLGPKERQLFQIIDCKEPNKGIQLLDISFHLFGKALDARLRGADEDEVWSDFFHFEDGLSLKINWSERTFGGKTFHEADGGIDFKVRQQQYDFDEWIEKVVDLDTILIDTPYDELKEILDQTAPDPKAANKAPVGEDDAPPKRTRPAPVEQEELPLAPRRRAPVEDPEPEPAPRRRAPVQEEEAEPPKRRAPVEDPEPEQPRRRAPVQEEEPAPRRRPVEDPEPEQPRRRAPVQDEEPAPRRRAPVEDPEPEPAPQRRKAPVVQEEEQQDPPPRRRTAPVEEEPAPRRRAPVEDEAPAPKPAKRPPNWDDFDANAPAPKKK